MSLDSATEYALSFGGDAVHLQKRDRPSTSEARGRQPAWRHLGSVDFDEPDFREVLINLRTMATGEPADVPLTVSLVIPDDQILYTTLTVVPSGDRDRMVARALDGLTPYAIEELAFDWRGEGDSVRVAAVARQTLREARDFAAQYGFEGDGFCADPEEGLFSGEPVFVLEAQPRLRPVVNLGSAGVTLGGLMIEEEPVAAPVETPVETAPEAVPASEPAEIASDVPTDAPPDVAASVEPAPEQVPDEVTGAGVQTPAAASVAPVTEVAAPVAPQPTSPPVVRHAPARPAAVAHSAPEAPQAPSPLLSQRARAVHKRAAEARLAKSHGTAAPAAPSAPARAAAPHRRGLSNLAAMMVTLVVGLVLIWAFLGPQGKPTQIAAAPAVVEKTDSPPVPVEADPVVVEEITTTSEASALTAPDVESPSREADAAVAAPVAPVTTPAPETASPEKPAPAPAAQQVMVSDLPPEHARRVLVAASATAAAVVLSGDPGQPKPAPVADAAPAPAVVPVPPEAAKPAAVAVSPAPKSKPAVAETPARAQPKAPAVVQTRLTNSVRPQLSPRRSTPQTSEPRADTAPRVPESPLPYTASQKSGQPANSARPPQRKRVDRSGATKRPLPERESASAPESARPIAASGSRPPQRPEGSAPEIDEEAALDVSEQRQLEALILDLRGHGLITTKASVPDGFGPRYAEVRPKRKPTGAKTVSDAVSPSAVDAALKSATEAPPARNSGGLLNGSSRPSARPGNRASTARISDEAVEKAIAAAVDASPAIPNSVKLASSPLPPRRSGSVASAASEAAGAVEAAAPAATAAAPAAAAVVAAAVPGPSEAEMAARRALDEQLQSQAEARIRARAQADAAAEAQARAQAEARARAQAAAEERAARARKQEYKPPEIDDEPEVASNAARGGTTSATVAGNATQKRGMDTGRTTIIGIIGAGNASRALIRLRSGKVVTVRLGDKIDGGTINSIGNGRLTYVKAGRTRELRLLDGR
ncbi:hypothetical protein [Paracoccus aestuariivivens]|uniref:Translation initiation factor 2 n=1 Tax=Paracoccus aestuariivivens TaxID=1820333 RepID=A0A6L6JBV4_9RHOB|nr:hypothetical protein [Paracoccus aestuariivivens]MTH78675.1 hypothetical protein [Paracoccus aestuariivivens]